MRTLVTGGAGLIGSHLVRKLVRNGRDVLVVDDFSKRNWDNLRDLGAAVEVHEFDLRGNDFPPGLFHGVSTVFHLAARVGSVQYLHGGMRAELAALQQNVLIDTSVFRACVEHRVPVVVYASSVSVYPVEKQQSVGVVLGEDDLASYNPDGGYGWAKLLGELQLQWMNSSRVGIARIFNVYGEGEEPGEHAHVIPSLIRKAVLYPSVPFQVWGDGRQSRDLLYVEDVVDGLLQLERVASSPPTVVNLGSGAPVEVWTLVSKIIEISGKPIVPAYDVNKPVGPISRTAEISRAQYLLGWRPRVDLNTGLRRTYEWVEDILKRTSDTTMSQPRS